jgi:hypothetical protein
MPHDVFISYSRDDPDLCDKVLSLIRKLGFTPYRDVDDFTGGKSWREQRDAALNQTEPKPYVIVLGTKATVAKPQGVVDEIRLARQNELTVIPIEFDPGATRFLLAAAGFERPGEIHYIDANEPSGGYVVGERVEDGLRRALTRTVRGWLERQRTLARAWAERLRPTISFWESTWSNYFPLDEENGLSGSVALTARGGSGKSFLIAHCVRHLLEDLKVYPVRVDETMLRGATDELAGRLGARSQAELPRQVEALAVRPPGEHRGWKPMRVVFIVDGLDQMVTPGDVQQKQLVDALNLLVTTAPVLVGCRQEVWDTWYAGRVSVNTQRVAELDERQARDLLRRHTALGAASINPLLQVPFFLGLVLDSASARSSLPRTETDFLQQTWSEAVIEGYRGDTGRRWVLENLAACQLEQLAYDVPLFELRGKPGFLAIYERGLRELEEAGLLVEQVRTSGPTVRLRHDLLDNYSMMQVLMNATDTRQAIGDLCRRCDKDCGWSLLATLVQAAHDWRDGELRRGLFNEFLYLLDHKKFGDEAMSRAWAVSHVLMACFHSLFDLILEALAGTPVDSLDRNAPDHDEKRGSRLGPPAALTQEAASSLAASFMALQPDRLDDAEAAVPVLASGLQVWPLKGRFLDALGKFRTDDALTAIVDFTRRQLKERTDIRSLRYAASNLQHFSQPEVAELLREMMADSTLEPMVRRMAAEGLNLRQPGVRVPPRSEDEIVDGLQVRDPDGSYSDWRVVQEYAHYVRGRVARGERCSRRVLVALTEALHHDQTFVRRSVAQALGLFDEREAREALLDELLESTLPAEVRSACLEALELQLRRAADPRARQVFRYFLLRASRAARRADAEITERGLADLALTPKLRSAGDWAHTAEALEVVPPNEESWPVRCSVAEVEAHPAVLRELADVGMEDVGPNLEPKYCFAALRSLGGGLDVTLAPTTWQIGRNFHNAVRKYPHRFLREGEHWLEPVPLGDTRLPGLAVVHGILLTADHQVLLTQRSAKLAYAPLHWSMSFEEQITARDVQAGDSMLALAAHRGVLEEFGITVDRSRIHVVSMLLELSNLNLATVVLIETAQTVDEIRQIWSGEPPPSHAGETEAIAGIAADPAVLEDLAAGAEGPFELLHPTSRLRCAILARWLRLRGD